MKLKKKKVPSAFFSVFLEECKSILQDILFAYKNFLHFCISKLCISTLSIFLGVLFFIPLFLLAGVVMLIDPISWSQVMAFILSGSDVSLELIGGLAAHPYWLVGVLFLVITAFLAFLLFSSYSLMLTSRLALKYADKKRLGYTKNLYFSRKHIMVFAGIIAWNMMYFLLPAIIAIGCVFFLYLFLNSGFVSQATFEILATILMFIFIITLVYLTFRLLFGYILLADSKKKKHFGSSWSFVQKSIEITRGAVFFKFVFIACLYGLIMMPFNAIGEHIDEKIRELTLARDYKMQSIENIDDEELSYYKYITKEYEDYSAPEIIRKVGKYSWISIFYGIFLYFLFGGLFTIVMTSFYKRILAK